MFAKMGGQRVTASSSAEVALDTVLTEGVRGAPDVAAFAGLEGRRLSVMAWHYHDDDLPGPEAAVELEVAGLPAAANRATATHHRIDEHHSNAYGAWKRMGSPIAPTPEQYAELQAASRLARLEAPAEVAVEGGRATLRFSLPRQAVSLIVLEW
jgi:xylan 1,4-beta-xylosidase